jgi:hypothetical protein
MLGARNVQQGVDGVDPVKKPEPSQALELSKISNLGRYASPPAIRDILRRQVDGVDTSAQPFRATC